ncbi:transcriptional regulator [Herbiconiux liukaitaii]|uniref:transcriptional regulator n=1 Tax=Herbiconiux liukaitaii TaxID=3342799 RepID=UPI0035B75ABF
MTTVSDPSFSEVIHAPLRLRICGLLRHVDELDFAIIRDALQVDDAKLSKHLRTLADAGFVALRKERSPQRADARRLTWVSLTPAGSTALEAHLAALADIAAGRPPH